MLLRMDVLAQIRDGTVDRAYRRWNRPTVRAGGTLTTAVGVLDVLSVQEVDPATLTDADARKAGEADRDGLIACLEGERGRKSVRGRPSAPRTGPVYDVRLAFRGADPRVAMREDASEDAVRTACSALDRLDRSSRRGPWTAAVLDAIAAEPGRRAPDLAERFGLEVPVFKADVRKLKALGLTESLEVGYRLSPRGEAVRAARIADASGAADAR